MYNTVDGPKTSINPKESLSEIRKEFYVVYFSLSDDIPSRRKRIMDEGRGMCVTITESVEFGLLLYTQTIEYSTSDYKEQEENLHHLKVEEIWKFQLVLSN